MVVRPPCELCTSGDGAHFANAGITHADAEDQVEDQVQTTLTHDA